MIYCDGKKKDEKLQAISNAEQNYEKEFANFVKKMHKRKREASKDSKDNLCKSPVYHVDCLAPKTTSNRSILQD